MAAAKAPRRIGIDTGGTFTDVATLVRGGMTVHKVPSTPDDPGRAVLDGLAATRAAGEAVDVVHGTTVGINAVLTGSLAVTAFVTNEGFEDLIEIGRQERADLYDLQARKARIPVPRNLRFGVRTRRSPDGRRLTTPTAEELEDLRNRLAGRNVEAIAIGLLHSYRAPEDEHAIAAALAPLGLPITCSADLLPVSGEFERFCACILNAATRPRVSAYLERLNAPIRPGRLRLMRSSGGVMGAQEASQFPSRAMFSGPAGGVIAARALAARAGFDDVAALDMGGTSTDVCLVRRTTQISTSTIAGLPLSIPSVEVHTVGCGGGSLAYADAGGALRVGPESAGADPGPACYGKGNEPTVTDAHVVMGHLAADTLLDGGFPIDPDRSVRAIEKLARKLGLDPLDTAAGILDVARIHMMRALLVITVQRAVDPARVPLIAYGGAGGLHAADLMRLLEMPAAVVPEHPGAFSAVGLALAGESAEQVLPVLQRLADLNRQQIQRLVEKARTRSERALADAAPQATIRTTVTLGMRYAGQGPSLAVPLRFPLERAAARAHHELFGFVPEDRPLELVEIRARAETNSRALPTRSTARDGRPALPHCRRKSIFGSLEWRVFRRADIRIGQILKGPALVEELTGTTVVPAGFTCRSEPYGLRLLGRVRGARRPF